MVLADKFQVWLIKALDRVVINLSKISVFEGLRYSIDGRSDPNMLTRDGKMYLFDFNNPGLVPREMILKNFDKSYFNPAGIDVYVDLVTKETLVFVVNCGNKHSIEIFQFDHQNLALHHKKTIRDKNIYLPNDVVAVGEF